MNLAPLEVLAPSNVSLTNAIGVVNPTQLRAVRAILRNVDGGAWLILLHHQVVEYPVLGIPLRDRIGLALMNAADLLAAISPHAERGAIRGTVLCSAPSVTMGLEKYRGRFTIHEFTVSSTSRIRVTANERINTSVTPPALSPLHRGNSREAA